MTPTTGTVEAMSPGGLFSGYQPPAGGFDEVVTSRGELRGPWVRFASTIETLGASGLSHHAEQARRILRENGVSYHNVSATGTIDCPWELDSVPLLFSTEDWRQLADGVAQRAALLNQILADLYGPQRLLKERILPPDFFFSHFGSRLPCHGLNPPGDVHLHLYACHLARQHDGRWLVVADRSQGPTGTGYALENRIVTSRILPRDFQSLYVERLAPFFISLRETLRNLAPQRRDNPRIVLLSSGPRSPTYFEDAYLARYLNYALVEGGDLTVRGDEVFLKTLGGLLPVDVILRRVPDEDCDPLELNPESSLGSPGLLQAVRSGKVAIANTIGSGLVEVPALLAFMPQICRFLRSEDLLLPSVGTWWCGRADDRRYVEEHLEELLIRPAFHYRTAPPKLGWRLSATQKKEVLQQMQLRPNDFVAQRRAERSTAPVWTGNRFQPWQVGLRAFAVANGAGYQVLRGGISRVSEAAELLGESMTGGERSKDVWVLSDAPVPVVSLLRPANTVVELRRSVNDLPSRAADNLMWLGRHLERAESVVRQLRCIIVRLTNELDPISTPELIAILRAISSTISMPDPKAGKDSLTFVREELLSLVFSHRAGESLRDILQQLYRTAFTVRDRISIDSWRIVNQLHIDMLFPWDTNKARLADVLLLLNQLLNLLSALGGLGTESMTRGLGWRFLDLGRRTERSLQTLRLLDQTLVEQLGEGLAPMLEAVLEIADSSMTYRYRYLASLQLAPVLDLLVFDETNPRAVAFQLNSLVEHVQQLPREPWSSNRDMDREIIHFAQSVLESTQVESLVSTDNQGRHLELSRFLEQMTHSLSLFSDIVTRNYLTHTGASHLP